jgi:hypothetical protein
VSQESQTSLFRRRYYRWKREGFRWAINQGDKLNLWLQDTFGLEDPQQKTLEAIQDRTSLKKLEKTIGKALNILPMDS